MTENTSCSIPLHAKSINCKDSNGVMHMNPTRAGLIVESLQLSETGEQYHLAMGYRNGAQDTLDGRLNGSCSASRNASRYVLTHGLVMAEAVSSNALLCNGRLQDYQRPQVYRWHGGDPD